MKQVDLWDYDFSDYPDNYFDGLLSDPPYEIGFSNKTWDNSGIAFNRDFWKCIYRVLKPGAFLFVYGGTRTHHRVMTAVEDVGFEIRDVMMWMYGMGFPRSYDISNGIDKDAGEERQIVGYKKGVQADDSTGRSDMPGKDVGVKQKAVDVPITAPSTDLAKKFDGYGTALKPSYEPIIVSMKPLDKGFVNNAKKWGVAGLNIGGSRISGQKEVPASLSNKNQFGWSTSGYMERKSKQNGRWPANVILDGSDEVEDLLPDNGKSGIAVRRNKGKAPSNNIQFGARGNKDMTEDYGYTDSGSVARFFYSAKAMSGERHAGCENLYWKKNKDGNYSLVSKEEWGQLSPEENGGQGNIHATVKPLSLNQYLSRMFLPPLRENDNRKLLVPFSGSGSEIIGAMIAGWDEVHGLEYGHDHIEIAKNRIEYWREHDLDEKQKKANSKENKSSKKDTIKNLPKLF
jgi:site-specific DNA-methyltransferase (adenine-specific)